MTTSWKKLRSDFPSTRTTIHLDHASGGPVPRPVIEAVDLYYRENAKEADLAWPKWLRRREEVRRKVAQFIHAAPEEITFTQSTSQGMNYIAELLANRGTVLTNECEFPSSTLPWLWRKSRLIFQKQKANLIPVHALERHLKPSVKTIVSSFVQYSTGFRQDLAALGRAKAGRFLVINATQGFGALPVDVQKWKADFLCTNSYKWLMAGYGGGVLYIRKKWLQKFKSASIGWRSMKDPEAMDNKKLDPAWHASRYEYGCPSFPTIFAVGAAVEYLAGIGIERIEKRILELTEYAAEGLERLGFEVVSPRQAAHRSGIIVFKAAQAHLLWKRLLGERLYVSPRGEGIRIAPHFYNTFEEIEIFLKKLKKHCKR